MLAGLTMLLFRKELKVEIVDVGKDYVDFSINDSNGLSIISVPRDKLMNSEIVQIYFGRRVSKVVDIKETKNPYFVDKPHNGYEIHLDSGIIYIT